MSPAWYEALQARFHMVYHIISYYIRRYPAFYSFVHDIRWREAVLTQRASATVDGGDRGGTGPPSCAEAQL